MRKYLDNALWIDLGVCVVLTMLIVFFKSNIHYFFATPKIEILDKFSVSLITVGTTLAGFLLTIVTVIITFKNSFDSQKPVPDKPEDKNVFEKKITKQEQFYDSNIHKHVMRVFLNATYEMGLVIFSLLLIQSGVFEVAPCYNALITFLCFGLVTASVIRSFYIFYLFLNVHLNERE